MHGGKAACELSSWRSQHSQDRRCHLPGVGVDRQHLAQPLSGNELADAVAPTNHHRQPRPDVVEQAGAEAEARLQVVKVDAGAEISIKQVGGALVVGHPVVEEDRAVEQAQGATAGGGLRYLARGWHNSIGVARPHEKETSARFIAQHQRHSLYQGDRVEPVPDATGPDNHLIVRCNARVYTLEGVAYGLRRRAADTEGQHVDQQAQRLISSVVVGVDPLVGGEHPQPVVALLLAGAEEEVPCS